MVGLSLTLCITHDPFNEHGLSLATRDTSGAERGHRASIEPRSRGEKLLLALHRWRPVTWRHLTIEDHGDANGQLRRVMTSQAKDM